MEESKIHLSLPNRKPLIVVDGTYMPDAKRNEIKKELVDYLGKDYYVIIKTTEIEVYGTEDKKYKNESI